MCCLQSLSVSRMNNYFGIMDILCKHDSGVLCSAVGPALREHVFRAWFPKIFTHMDPVNAAVTHGDSCSFNSVFERQILGDIC